jgi:OOP family OmpA-OmpF porin
MVKKLIKRMFLASPLVGLMLTGCAPMADKNQAPPPVEPPSETMYLPQDKYVPPSAPASEPEMIVLEGVHFDFDKATLKPSAVDILDHAVNVMQRYPNHRFNLSGHTDNYGSDQYNEGLAQRRANAVRDYLVQHGVDSSRLDVSSYGERMPVADNATKQGRAKNRRVEIAPQ